MRGASFPRFAHTICAKIAKILQEKDGCPYRNEYLRNSERGRGYLHGFGTVLVRLIKEFESHISQIKREYGGENVGDDPERSYCPGKPRAKEINEVHPYVPVLQLHIAKAEKAAHRHEITGELVRYLKTFLQYYPAGYLGDYQYAGCRHTKTRQKT
jgi:hypothetical protein